MSVETVTPTEAELTRAAALVAVHSTHGADRRLELTDAIAQALAEQRAKIVGRYEALADDLDTVGRRLEDQSIPASNSYRAAAERIRSVAR